MFSVQHVQKRAVKRENTYVQCFHNQHMVDIDFTETVNDVCFEGTMALL